MPVKKEFFGKEVLTDIEKGVSFGLLKGAELAATNIGRETPVDTGRLRSSIAPNGKIEKGRGRFSTRVETNVEYAKFVEFGTSRMKPRSMFRKGADQSVAGILALIKKELPK